ncbi:unnamed protein product [Symbiodinium necroappetens]|uniref:Uncharacterized protein n=1 Tax=Symbiodinium necroappetens TaxID=1628268 RepID=A0A812YA52_9DINO|nr:unnamed protein product [Symbiodinium necroappetens]
MGRARQLYGQESSFGLWGPTLAVMVVAAFCLICWLTAAKPPDVQQSVRQIWEDSALGQNRDQRGCLQAAGFVWCEGAGKCIRPWKEACPGGTDFCRNYCAEQKRQEASQRPRNRPGSHSVFCRCAGEDDVERAEVDDKRLDKRDVLLLLACSGSIQPRPCQAKWQSLELHPGSLWRPRKHRSNYQRCEAAGLAGDLGEEVRPAGAKRSQLEAENDLEGSSEGHRNRSLESWFSGLQGLPN